MMNILQINNFIRNESDTGYTYLPVSEYIETLITHFYGNHIMLML